MQRNSYCSLKALSFLPFSAVPTMCNFPPSSRPEVGFGRNFVARMASRRMSKRTRLLSICRIHSHYSIGACG
jgi:hypothetical protein